MGKFASAFDADEMRKFMSDYVRDPWVRAPQFKIPVRQKKIDGVFVGNCGTIRIQGVLNGNVNAKRHIDMITGNDGIVNGFCRRSDASCVSAVFRWINIMEVFRRCSFPSDFALIARKGKFGGCGETAKEKRGEDCPYDFHNRFKYTNSVLCQRLNRL